MKVRTIASTIPPKRRWIGAAFALLLGVVPSSVRADEASAAEAFRVGKDAYARKEYRGAALAFEAAFREHPHGAALFNAAQSWLAANSRARAADAFASCLEKGGLDSAQEGAARKHLGELEASLGMVLIDAPRGSTVSLAHHERVVVPISIHLVPGHYTVHVDFPDGTSEDKDIDAKAGARVTMAFASARPKSAPIVPPKKAKSIFPMLGAASLGGALFAGVGVVALGTNALAAQDAFDASGFTNIAARERALELQMWTNGMLVTTGVLGVLGVAFVVASRKSESATALRVAPGYAALSVSF